MAERVEERRKHPRLHLKLNVAFKPSEDEQAPEAHGTTLNVSAGGVCFEVAEWTDIAPGSQLALRISGFSRYGTGSLFRELHGKGTVLRLEPPEENARTLERARIAVRLEELPHFEIYDWAG